MKKSGRRSPLRERPLRAPGQSIQDEIDRIWIDEVFQRLSVAIVAVGFAIIAWVHWVTKSPPNPWLYTALALVVLAYTLLRLRAVGVHLRQLRQGQEGERAVAEVLDSLRTKGAAVFHDVIGKGFNVDHVVLSRTGIYVIETKTVSKRPGATVTVHGGAIQVDGRPLDRDPIRQARAVADWVRSTLTASTGRTFPVRAVVLFPGWYVEPMKGQYPPDIWVLNPKAFPAFVESQPVQISEPDLNLAAFHMARYIKSAVQH
jgi:hypothetical protein